MRRIQIKIGKNQINKIKLSNRRKETFVTTKITKITKKFNNSKIINLKFYKKKIIF